MAAKKNTVTTRSSGLCGIEAVVISIIDRAAKDFVIYPAGHCHHDTAVRYFQSELYKSDLAFLGLDTSLLPTILRGEQNE